MVQEKEKEKELALRRVRSVYGLKPPEPWGELPSRKRLEELRQDK